MKSNSVISIRFGKFHIRISARAAHILLTTFLALAQLHTTITSPAVHDKRGESPSCYTAPSPGQPKSSGKASGGNRSITTSPETPVSRPPVTGSCKSR
jgi:hypothetical protein